MIYDVEYVTTWNSRNSDHYNIMLNLNEIPDEHIHQAKVAKGEFSNPKLKGKYFLYSTKGY